MYEKKLIMGDFGLEYQYLNVRSLKFVAFSLSGKKIIENIYEMHRMYIIVKAFATNKLSPMEKYRPNQVVTMYREKVGNEEFLMLRVGTKVKAMDKVTVLEIQSILEKFLARVDLFDI